MLSQIDIEILRILHLFGEETHSDRTSFFINFLFSLSILKPYKGRVQKAKVQRATGKFLSLTLFYISVP